MKVPVDPQASMSVDRQCSKLRRFLSNSCRGPFILEGSANHPTAKMRRVAVCVTLALVLGLLACEGVSAQMDKCQLCLNVAADLQSYIFVPSTLAELLFAIQRMCPTNPAPLYQEVREAPREERGGGGVDEGTTHGNRSLRRMGGVVSGTVCSATICLARIPITPSNCWCN